MIAITNPNLAQFADEHLQAIKNYFKDSTLKKINADICHELGKDWDFDKIILAKPAELKKLAIARNKNKKIFKKSYYGYLSDDKFFFINENSEKVFYRGSSIIEKLGIQVCPYCNRNFVYNLQGKRTTYQLDHFYPQTEFPFLALSFYNLIPSCLTCNGLLGKKDKKVLVNPYDKDFPFHKISFKINILKPDFYYNVESFDIEIDLSRLSENEKKDFESNLTVFQLNEHYKKHKAYILKLIQKNVTYSEAYLEELKKFRGTIFGSVNEMKGLLNENYDKNFHLRPLSKLTHDIAQELGLID